MDKNSRTSSPRESISRLDRDPYRQLLKAIEREDIPERLLELARELQEKLRANEQDEG